MKKEYKLTYNKDLFPNAKDITSSEIIDIEDSLIENGFQALNPEDTDYEVESIMENGGTFEQGGAVAFEVEIDEVEDKEENEENEEGEFMVVKILNDNTIQAVINENFDKERFNYELIKGNFESFNDAENFAKEYIEKNTKTPFNDAKTFVEEFKDYLIGKKINDNDVISKKIINVRSSLNEYEVEIMCDDESVYNVKENLLQGFIDGKSITQDSGPDYPFNLILQDEITPEIVVEEKINQPDYKYYVVNIKNDEWRIQTGWEYREDANDDLKEQHEYGNTDTSVVSKRTLISNHIDPDDNINWKSDKHDWSIIEDSMIDSENGLTKEMSVSFVEGFKNGKFSSVIKANLIYYLECLQRKLRVALTYSEIEKIKLLDEKIQRIIKELMRIIQKENN